MQDKIAALEKQITALQKINRVLMGRVERSIDSSGSDYALFEHNIILHEQVEKRTAELEEKNRQLTVTLKSITDGVISTNLEKQIVLMNAVAENLTGWTLLEAQGKALEEIFCVTGLRQNIIPKGNSKLDLVDVVLHARTGDNLSIEGTCAPILHFDRSVTGYLVVFRDQTERRRLQEQVALSSKLQSIGQLAAGIAHEINTPMQFIGDNAGFLRKSFDEVAALLESYQLLEAECSKAGHFPQALSKIKQTSSEVDSDYLIKEIPAALDETISGIKRVTKLVQAMKTFSHPNEGKIRECDLNQSIEATVNVCRNEWKYVSDLQLDLDSSLPPVPCLMDELNQVILNMVTNSVHSIQDAINTGRFQKGTIRVVTKNQGNEVHIQINDSGMGMPPEVARKIYDPFFTTKEPGKGTGQGLAISHDIIVNKHKGRIEVESEVGVGTQFTIILPLQEISATT